MNQFIIEPESLWFTNPRNDRRERRPFIERSIQAYYHADYEGGRGIWREDGTIENIICTLKNDITPYSDEILHIAVNRLDKILRQDLPILLKKETCDTICVVPRSFAEDTYQENQLLFRKYISDFISKYKICGQILENGTNYIVRHTSTKCTHRARWGHGGDGNMPYPGITKETCHISPNVRGKNILLIDDLYTRSVGIDEDAIQALLDNGANNVIFYSLGKTIYRGN